MTTSDECRSGLRELIDFLDDLDGPNPLMMGKQKYCFLKHFWRTANNERKRSTQHGDATKVGRAISAASNPARHSTSRRAALGVARFNQ